MKLYSGTSQQFIEDTIQNQIAEKMKLSFFNHFRFNPSEGEVRSWQNSLRALSQVFAYSNLMDHGILLEYQLPLTSKRLDCMISGTDCLGKPSAVIVELKQWDKCEESNADNEVVTWVGGSKRDVLHPSVQVGQYQMYLEDTHTAFYEGADPVRLNSCAYLHNYHYYPNDVILAEKFQNTIKKYPMFAGDDVPKLKDFLCKNLEQGNGIDVLNRIESSKYRPSKKLMEHVGSVIIGMPEYILLDEQKIVYDKVFAEVREGFHDRKTTVVIVKGGPGTGKSVIAINLMANLLLDGYNAQYATGSKAFTETLRKIIGNRGSVQFKYFNSYSGADDNEVDVLICDEAHRIRKSSVNRFTPAASRTNIPQIEELIKAAKVLVCFIDDDQIVRPDEIGSVAYIKETAERQSCKILEYELEAQFRCSGSEAFVNWINNTLGIKRTANVLWDSKDETFDFKIFNSAIEMENAIKTKLAEGYTSRITAGFCWSWSDPDQNGYLADDVRVGKFIRAWNAKPDARRLASNIPKAPLWAHDPNGFNQVGCIYTAQGFEFDYVGVIFGNDLIYSFDQQQWIGVKENSHDTVVKRSRDKFVDLVKNTYRVLMSRGMKGCYVCFLDKDTERFFRSRME